MRGQRTGERYIVGTPCTESVVSRVRENQSQYLHFLPNADGDHLSAGAYPSLLEPALGSSGTLNLFCPFYQNPSATDK